MKLLRGDGSNNIVTHQLQNCGMIHEDLRAGTAAFAPLFKLRTAFTVRIADVTGVTWKRRGLTKCDVKVYGAGTVLAELDDVYTSVAEGLDAWFRERAVPTRGGAISSVADELAKLAALRDAGVLTDAEFATQKARVLGQ